MTKREVIKRALEHKRPPYVPWFFNFTEEAKKKVTSFYGNDDIIHIVDNHIIEVENSKTHYHKKINQNLVQNIF